MVVPAENVLSLERLSRQYLMDGRDNVSWLLLMATLMVGVGVALEGLEIAHAVQGELPWLRITRLPRLRLNPLNGLPRNSLNRRALVAAFGWLLVAVGVVGEFWLEDWVSQFDVVIRTIDNDLFVQAQTETASANERAGNAMAHAAQLEKDAAALHAQAKTSDARISNAQTQVAQLRTQAEALRKQNLEIAGHVNDTKRVLGELEIKRLELEQSLAPRVLSFQEYTDGTTNMDDLRGFPGMEAVIEFVPDLEARRTAYNIAFLLGKEQAGWKVISMSQNDKIPWDGVTVKPYLWIGTPDFRDHSVYNPWQQVRTSIRAAESLERLFRQNNWEVQRISADSTELRPLGMTSPGAIKIEVGFKPSPYFQDPDAKERKKADDIRLGIDRNKPAKQIRREVLLTGPNNVDIYRSVPPQTPRP